MWQYNNNIILMNYFLVKNLIYYDKLLNQPKKITQGLKWFKQEIKQRTHFRNSEFL